MTSKIEQEIDEVQPKNRGSKIEDEFNVINENVKKPGKDKSRKSKGKGSASKDDKDCIIF